MTPQRARRLLLIGVGLSLLVHVIFALVARWPELPKEQIAQRISHVQIVRIARVPSPQPSAATPAPARVHATTRAKVALTTLSRTQNGQAAAASAPQAPPSPRPVVSGQKCSTRNAPSTRDASPPPPELTPDVRAQGTSGTTSVLVHLDDKGNVLDAQVTGSSGSPTLDVAALAMAKGTTYAPAIANCKAIASDYTFTAKFIAW